MKSSHRELEDLWKQVFPFGTEWDHLDSELKWNFKNLEDAFEDGGVLHGRKVYLFTVTEPESILMSGQAKIIFVPVVVAVVSLFPPSDKIAITSVQSQREEIVDMKQMKMDWVPYIPYEKRGASVERLNSQIFVLSCAQRSAASKHLKMDRVKKFEYCFPYFYNPFREDEMEHSTVVDIMFPAEPRVVCEFDWKLDELEEFTKEYIAEDLTEDQKDEFKEFVKEKVREAKSANQEAREKRKKAQEEMDQTAFDNMKFYKFYPVTPDVTRVKTSFINRYYGKAHQVL